jgi:acetyl esterase/lipase
VKFSLADVAISSMAQPLDIRPLLDPEISALLAASPIDIGAALGSLTNESVVEIRTMFGATPPPPLSDSVERTDYPVPGRDGVTVRVHRPKNVTDARPCVYWMHGGGLVIGDNKMDDARFDNWCNTYGIVGVSVDYRLAPEHPYPTPLDDCYAGLAWVVSHASELGVDTSRLGIGGASAGAGLAAGLALLARDRGEYSVAFQLLIYPMIDDRQITVSSTWSDPIWSPSANTFGWTAYLGAKKGTADVEPYAAASRATNLVGLPPTLIAVGALDGF